MLLLLSDYHLQTHISRSRTGYIVCCLCIRKYGREWDMNIHMHLLIISKGNTGKTGQKLIKMAANKELCGGLGWRAQN